MKKLFYFLLFLPSLFFTSCEGDQGPPGLDGTNLLGSIFEINADFSSANDYREFFNYPSDLEVFETDVVLIYLLEETVSDGNGGFLDVWSLLPQTFFTPDGILVYNFDYTFIDVSVFLDSDFDLSLLGPEFTQNQIFRVAVLPADLAQNIDTFNIEAVMNASTFTTID